MNRNAQSDKAIGIMKKANNRETFKFRFSNHNRLMNFVVKRNPKSPENRKVRETLKIRLICASLKSSNFNLVRFSPYSIDPICAIVCSKAPPKKQR